MNSVKVVKMRRRYESLAFGLFVLTMANLSAARCCPEKPLEPKGVTTQPCEVITPPQAPQVPNCVNVFLTADFIYWRASADTYQYAASGTPVNGPDGFTPIPPSHAGKTPSPAFDFQPGFKFGAGLKFAHDGWDLYANYTWLNPATLTSSQSAPSGDMVGPSDPYYGAPTLSNAKDYFRQSFNILDLELGRKFFLSQFMTLRPYYGLKTAWITQYRKNVLTVFNNLTNGLNSNASTTVPPIYTITALTQTEQVKSWGIGIRGGVAPVWYFMKNFGLYGNLGVSGLCTFFQNHSKTFYKGFTTATLENFTGQTANIKRSFLTVTPVIELGLGFTYMMFFHKDAYALTLSAGWEEQMWIGFNGGSPGGNLTLQGFTFNIGFEF
jgi:hypothetical protein